MSEQNPPQYPQQPGQPYGQQQPGQPGQPGYPTQGYYQQGPPPKKKHTLRNVLLVLLALAILFIGGCAVLFGAAVNEVDKAIEEGTSQDAQPGGPDNPLEIDEGKPFEVSGFKYQSGWSITSTPFGWDIKALRVENTREDKDGALIEIKLWKGKEVLSSTDCSSDQIDVGTIAKVTCIGGDKLPKGYDRITINDTF